MAFPNSHSYNYDLASSSPVSSTSSELSFEEIGHWSNMSQVSRAPTVTELDLEPVTRHPSYYIPSGDVVFLVEAQLFRVHRYFFVRESVKFRDMLSTPSPSGTELMGSSDTYPIILSEVSKEEFVRFLWVFYNDEYSYDASVEKWSSILRLAHIWQFAKVKELAVREMDKLEVAPVDKAVMAREYEVDPARKWLETAYAAISAREAPISKAEGMRLGLDIVLRLAEVRERIRMRRYSASSPQTPNPAAPGAQSIFEEPCTPFGRDGFITRGRSPSPCRSDPLGPPSRPLSPYRSTYSVRSHQPDHPPSPPPLHHEFSSTSSPVRNDRPPSTGLSPAGRQFGVTIAPTPASAEGYTKNDVADVRYVFGL